MENNTNGKPSMKISGAGSTSGGDYDEIKISGSGKINGNSSCNYFKVSGSASIDGDMQAEEVVISGSAKFKGILRAGYMRVSGAAKTENDVFGREIKISGTMAAFGSISGDQIDVSGILKSEKDCNAERFTLSGQCRIGGLLNADEVEIYLEGKSEIKTIGAEKIRVTMGRYNSLVQDIVSLFTDHSGKLICDAIEADEIYLENTICEVVRGARVMIGKGCQIKTVEYTETLDVSENARVGEQIRTGC